MVSMVDQMVDQNTTYLTRRRGVHYYYTRRIPKELQKRLGKKRIVVSLKTKSRRKAITSAIVLSERLESFWNGMKLEEIISQHSMTLESPAQPAASITLSEALDLYLRLKGKGKGETFERTARRNIEQLMVLSGDVSISELTSADGASFRDHLIQRGLASSSVKRCFASIRSIVSLAIQEHGLQNTNPFAKIFIPADDKVKTRPTMPVKTIKILQAECEAIDDPNRHLLALISDTGLRLSEALGLIKEDIVLDTEIPHLIIQEHPWRKLKTTSSKRLVPLIGYSYWAAERIMQIEGRFAFPNYTSTSKCSANSASAALNKWLKPRVPKDCVVHSFRHALRDRLRAVECPSDISDAIGGWSTSGIGHSYGNGYDLAVKKKWLQKIII
jgi:integrase